MVMFFIMMYGCYGNFFCSLEFYKFINAEKSDSEMVKQDPSEEKNLLVNPQRMHERVV